MFCCNFADQITHTPLRSYSTRRYSHSTEGLIDEKGTPVVMLWETWNVIKEMSVLKGRKKRRKKANETIQQTGRTLTPCWLGGSPASRCRNPSSRWWTRWWKSSSLHRRRRNRSVPGPWCVRSSRRWTGSGVRKGGEKQSRSKEMKYSHTMGGVWVCTRG